MKKLPLKGDVSQIANQVMRAATDIGNDLNAEELEARKLAAKILGRSGGLKGGPARAKKLGKNAVQTLLKKQLMQDGKQRNSGL